MICSLSIFYRYIHSVGQDIYLYRAIEEGTIRSIGPIAENVYNVMLGFKEDMLL